MTHPAARVEQALALRSLGLTARAIGLRLGIPRSTVSAWVSGNLPGACTKREQRCIRCGGALHPFDELPPDYPYLLGLYLGDGSIAAHHRDVYRLRLSLDPKYPGIIEEAARAMSKVMPTNKVQSSLQSNGAVEVSSYSKSWPCLFPQHGPGKKHHRRIVLAGWQEQQVRASPQLLLRGLIHSDGCRFMNTGRNWRHPRYVFSNLSADIRRIFTDACDLIGTRWTTSGRVVYVSHKADVAFMDTFIGPKA